MGREATRPELGSESLPCTEQHNIRADTVLGGNQSDDRVTMYTPAFEIRGNQRIHTAGRQERQIRVKYRANVRSARTNFSQTSRACCIEVRFHKEHFRPD